MTLLSSLDPKENFKTVLLATSMLVTDADDNFGHSSNNYMKDTTNFKSPTSVWSSCISNKKFVAGDKNNLVISVLPMNIGRICVGDKFQRLVTDSLH